MSEERLILLLARVAGGQFASNDEAERETETVVAEWRAMRQERDAALAAVEAYQSDITELAERAELAESKLARATRVRPDYPFLCRCCGAAHTLDTSIPSEVWNRIAPEGGFLCTLCIDERVAALGFKDIPAEFYFAGQGISSRLYTDSLGDVAMLRNDSAALTARLASAVQVLEGILDMPVVASEDDRPYQKARAFLSSVSADSPDSLARVRAMEECVKALRACVESIENIEEFISKYHTLPLEKGERFAEWSHPAVSLRMAKAALAALEEKK